MQPSQLSSTVISLCFLSGRVWLIYERRPRAGGGVPCTLYQYLVPCTCTMYLYHVPVPVPVPVPSTMYQYHVPVPCTSTLYMYLVPSISTRTKYLYQSTRTSTKVPVPVPVPTTPYYSTPNYIFWGCPGLILGGLGPKWHKNQQTLL